MKKFELVHEVFETFTTFSEDSPPDWMISEDYKWWWERHVLRLEVGERIESDFHWVRRIE